MVKFSQYELLRLTELLVKLFPGVPLTSDNNFISTSKFAS